MPIISPTVGRKVWYRPSEQDRGLTTESKTMSLMKVGNPSQPCDATVVYVHSDRMVNLMVLDHNGYPHQRWSVPMVQPGDEPPAAGFYCQWMPYQVGQAKAAV